MLIAKMVRSRLVVALLVGFVLCAARPVTAQSTQRRVLSKQEIDAITAQIQSAEYASINAAVAKIRALIPPGSIPSTDMAKTWIPALLQQERYQEVADMCMEMVLVAPSVGNVRDYLVPRIDALRRLNKTEEALQTAKSLYNGCDFRSIDTILNVVARSLAVAHPEDATVAGTFVTEQRMPTTQPSTTQPARDMLKGVKIDGALYERALATWKAKGEASIADAEKYVTLLLLADQPDTAEEVIKGLEAKNTDPRALQRYAEAHARVAKARDGNLSRALVMTREPSPAAPRDPGMP